MFIEFVLNSAYLPYRRTVFQAIISSQLSILVGIERKKPSSPRFCRKPPVSEPRKKKPPPVVVQCPAPGRVYIYMSGFRRVRALSCRRSAVVFRV